MKRREAIRHSAAIFTFMGAIPGLVLQTGCSPSPEPWVSKSFNELQGFNLRSAIDVLIPRTGVPSATDVGVHEFIDGMVDVIFDEAHTERFLKGLDRLNALAQESYGSDFHELEDEEKNAAMHAFMDDGLEQSYPGAHYGELSRLTMTGYFRSEEVCTKVLRHVAVPGRFEGCIPLEDGQPLWAE